MTTARPTKPSKPRKPAAKVRTLAPAPRIPAAPGAVQVGDRYALPVPDCGSLPLTWLVVNVLASHPDAVLIVPCDPVATLGPHDAPHPDGDTFARCRGATWASAAKLAEAERVPGGDGWRELARHCRGIIRYTVEGIRIPVTELQVETGETFQYAALLLAVRTVGAEVNRLYS